MRIHVITADTGAPWNLPLERFAEQLAAHWPDALVAVDPGNRRPQVRFELTYMALGPDLKIIVHHSGGTVPMLAGRLKTLQRGPETDQVAARLKHEPLEYLKRFYADTANFGNPIALRAALEFFGPEHVLFGTDFGFNTRFAPETIEDVETVIGDEELKRTIYERNARRLLRLDAAALVD